jgi:hypothetical protein
MIVRKVFFVFLFVAYFSVFPYNQGLNNPNENSRVYTTIALVEHHTWRIDDEVTRFGPINDAAVLDGHRLAAKAPAVSVLGVPVYWVFSKIAPHVIPVGDAGAWLRAATLVLRLTIVQIPCFLFLLWFFSWLRRQGIDESLSLIGTGALGIGTNYLAYSLMFVSHSLSAAIAFIAFTLIVSRSRPLLVGILLGFVTLLDYQGAVVSVMLGLFAIIRFDGQRARMMFIVGALSQLLLLLLFQHAAFGSAFRAPFHHLEDENLRAHHANGFLGFGLPNVEALRTLCTDRTVGLFGTSPFLWLTVAVVPLVWRKREAKWALGTVLVLLVAVSGITNWRAGWSIGPRYLVTAMPLAVFVAIAGLDLFAKRGELQRGIARGLAGGLLIASVATVGLISIVFNTLPYDISNPLMQVAIPFVRAGFVPHHAGELIGWTSPAFFSVAVVALFGAALVAAVYGVRGPFTRWGVAATICVVALAPVLVRPADCPRGVRRLTEIWEPQGRDRIGTLRAAAMQNPCLWHRVATLERSVCWEGADEDELRGFGGNCR